MQPPVDYIVSSIQHGFSRSPRKLLTWLRRHSLTIFRVLGALLILDGIAICFYGIPIRYDELLKMAPLDSYSVKLGLTAQGYALCFLILEVLYGLIISTIAAALVWHRYQEAHVIFYAIVVFAGIFNGASYFGPTQLRVIDGEFRARTPITIPAEALQWFVIATFIICLYTLPDGKFELRWTRILGAIWVTISLIWFLFPEFPFNQNYGDTWEKTPLLSIIVAYFFIGSGIAAQIQLYRRAKNRLRLQQIKWIMAGTLISYVGGVIRHLPPTIIDNGGDGAILLLVVVFMLVSTWPLCLAIAIVRYQLWEIDRLISRSLVYAILIALLTSIYVILLGLLGALLRTERPANNNLLISLIATAVVTVLFQPLRTGIQRTINRLMFGYRDDPYNVMVQLSKNLQAVIEARSVLNEIVMTISETLRLPYVAIALKQENTFNVAAQYPVATTRPSQELQILTLKHQNEIIGQLQVSPRVTGVQFLHKEQDLLETIARQAGIAVHNMRLAEELQRALTRIVTVTEDERRRISQDLHDELGGALGAIILQLDTSYNLLNHAPEEAQHLLIKTKSQVQAVRDNLRQIARDLYPPILVEMGLRRALEERIATYNRVDGLAIVLTIPALPPHLPAAVERAIYYIVVEGITNVVQHARAGTCKIHLYIEASALYAEIVDDGQGIPSNATVGVGLSSMRERAAALGGDCIWTSSPSGTLIRAWFPLSQ